MDEDYEVKPERGGARPGAGRPRGSSSPDAKRLAKAKADKEESIAKIRAIEAQQKAIALKEKVGDLVMKSEVERMFAEYVTVVVSILETLPDVLERDAGLPPEAVQRSIAAVDKIREELHEKIHKHFA